MGGNELRLRQLILQIAYERIRIVIQQDGADAPLKKSAAQTGLVLNEYVPASPIRAAFWARATTALRRIAERADETSLERAVAAPTDAGALARAISDYPGIGGAADELDSLRNRASLAGVH